MNRMTQTALFALVIAVSVFLFQGVGLAFYDDEEIMGKCGLLVGKTTKEDVYRACPAMKMNADVYYLNEDAIRQLKGVKDKVEVIAVLGTWSAESQQQAGRFFRILDETRNAGISVAIYAVDEDMSDETGIAERYRVDTLPTIIFLRNGKELGRIIEAPKTTLEAETLAILSAKGA
ncbi:MAG TPA: thioredoxin domain-containing protein [Syntrophobacter fumaroxidans]|nr:thioredoxin domain-containing protein [Syntrophobacter fumaroxidans]